MWLPSPGHFGGRSMPPSCFWDWRALDFFGTKSHQRRKNKVELAGTSALTLALSPRRGNGFWTFPVFRMSVRQIQPHEPSKRRQTFLLLRGEKAGMREV